VAERFFKTPGEFNDWLADNHQSEQELWVCYYKKHTGKQTITWEESVEEALCYGWIDGLKKTRDAESYKIRFTPRRKTSIWSPTNLQTINRLIREKRLQPAGRAIYEQRKKDHSVAYDNMQKDFELTAHYLAQVKNNARAWAYYQTLPPGYLKQLTRWIMTAKKEETRDRRFAKFLESCQAGKRLA
jgi:uncharacterized protein YdeI (YjbR/CyaY-like superfamily)